MYTAKKMCEFRRILMLAILIYVSCENMPEDRLKNALKVQIPELLLNLDEYLEMEEKRIKEISSAMEEMKKVHERVLSVINAAEGDPTSYYRFADFFATNWHRFQNNIDMKQLEVKLDRIKEIRHNLPTDMDDLGNINWHQ